jgi:hypothetical protein
MIRRVAASVGMAAVVVFVASLPVSGQGSGAAAPPLVITAFNGGPVPSYTVPKTPWGEPDLQGVWSSDDATFPVSRPQPGAGRGGAGRGTAPAAPAQAPQTSGEPAGLYLNDEQWAARQKQIKDGIVAAENAVSSFRGDFARRAFRQTSYVVDPPTGIMPQPTAEARKRAATRDRGTFGDGPFNTTEDFTLYDRCITRGVYGSVARVIYGNGNRIVQGPGMVAISYEMIHDTRVIYTDGRPHINNSIRQYLGDSRGHWEGDTLVVETTNLTDKTSIGANGNGLRHSDKMKMTEKIRRVADDIVQYQLTIDDPVTYPQPFTISIPLTPLDGGVLLPYECHEGNMAVRDALSAERTEDRALAEDAAKGIIRPRRGAQEGNLGAGGFGPGGNPANAPAGGRAGGAGGRAGGAPPEGDQER